MMAAKTEKNPLTTGTGNANGRDVGAAMAVDLDKMVRHNEAQRQILERMQRNLKVLCRGATLE